MRLEETIENNREVLDELAGILSDRRGSIVPFVGAGASIACGMPGWRGFLHYLANAAVRLRAISTANADPIRARIDAAEFEEAADALYSEIGRLSFETALQAQFTKPNHLAPVLEQIVGLADGLIITTNYDRNIETAWERTLIAYGLDEHVFGLLATAPADLQRALTGRGHAVLKLHGDVNSPETLVLTKTQYEHVYKSVDFERFLSRFFSAHRPLFIGCSMTEERILDAMEDDKAVGYAILAVPETEAERQRIVGRLKERVRIVWLAPETKDGLDSPHEVLEPLLKWLNVQRRVGRVIWDVDTPDEPWKSKLHDLRNHGHHADALSWILENWDTWKSWPLAVEYLRFADLSGQPAAWETYVHELCPTLPREQPPVIRHAVNYLSGRLHGQSGRWLPAFSLQAANSPHPPPWDHYQVMSWFEEGQLRFRTEDFEEAQRILEDVYYVLLAQPTATRTLVDVLKFLGTIQVLDTIYDVPFRDSDAAWIRGRFSNPASAWRLAEDAYRLAPTDYPDGRVWAKTVMAFAKDAERSVGEARRNYDEAEEMTRTRECRPATRFHVLLYKASFHRRNGELETAEQALDTAAGTELAGRRAPDDWKLAEQRALLALARNEHSEAYDFLDRVARTPRDALHMFGTTRLERRIGVLQRRLMHGVAGFR